MIGETQNSVEGFLLRIKTKIIQNTFCGVMETNYPNEATLLYKSLVRCCEQSPNINCIPDDWRELCTSHIKTLQDG